MRTQTRGDPSHEGLTHMGTVQRGEDIGHLARLGFPDKRFRGKVPERKCRGPQESALFPEVKIMCHTHFARSSQDT